MPTGEQETVPWRGSPAPERPSPQEVSRVTQEREDVSELLVKGPEKRLSAVGSRRRPDNLNERQAKIRLKDFGRLWSLKDHQGVIEIAKGKGNQGKLEEFDPDVFVFGLDADSKAGVFGSTKGLAERLRT